MGGNQTGRLRLGGILSNAKGNQSPRRKPEPHPTESANPGTPAPGTTHRPATRRHPGQRQVLNRRKHGRRNLSQPVLAAFRQNRKKSSHLRKPLWTLLIICGLLLAIKAIALARSRKHGSTQQRVAAGWQSVAALARQSGLDIRGTRSEQAVSIANQMDISRETLLALARKPITRPSPVISSTKSMCSSIGAILRRNASTCSSHCRRYADGVPNFRLPTFSTSAATAAGGTTAAIGSTIVRKDGTHDLP